MITKNVLDFIIKLVVSTQAPMHSAQKEDIELSDEEVVMNLLKTKLSNKKWDKAIKGLTKNNLARVEKTEGGLLVSLV